MWVRLRQSYLRIAKPAAMIGSRYADAKQFKRHHRQLRLLRSRLGRIIRDIRRKIAGRPEFTAVFEAPLARAAQRQILPSSMKRANRSQRLSM
jgi:transposase, IS5 family